MPFFLVVFLNVEFDLQKTAAGILIPEKAQESLNRGRVLAVGPGSEEHKVSLKQGDEVLLPSFGGTALKGTKEGEEELFVYRESEILAKISE